MTRQSGEKGLQAGAPSEQEPNGFETSLVPAKGKSHAGEGKYARSCPAAEDVQSHAEELKLQNRKTRVAE